MRMLCPRKTTYNFSTVHGESVSFPDHDPSKLLVSWSLYGVKYFVKLLDLHPDPQRKILRHWGQKDYH